MADESGAEGTVSIVGVDELDPARGKERRESSGSTNWSVASKLLKKRQGEVAEGKVSVSSVKQEKYTVNEMLDYLLVDHEMNAKTKTATYLVKHLRQCFGFDRAMFLSLATGFSAINKAAWQKEPARGPYGLNWQLCPAHTISR